MTAKIIKQTEELLIIEWQCQEKGFGELVLIYNDHGGYSIEAEYMKLSTVLEILKQAKI